MQQFTKGLHCFLLLDFPLGSPVLSHSQPQYALILSFASNNLLSVPVSVKMQFLPVLWILIMYSHLFRLYRLERSVFVFVIFHLNLPLCVFLVLRETFHQYVILFSFFFLFFLSLLFYLPFFVPLCRVFLPAHLNHFIFLFLCSLHASVSFASLNFDNNYY